MGFTFEPSEESFNGETRKRGQQYEVTTPIERNTDSAMKRRKRHRRGEPQEIANIEQGLEKDYKRDEIDITAINSIRYHHFGEEEPYVINSYHHGNIARFFNVRVVVVQLLSRFYLCFPTLSGSYPYNSTYCCTHFEIWCVCVCVC